MSFLSHSKPWNWVRTPEDVISGIELKISKAGNNIRYHLLSAGLLCAKHCSKHFTYINLF